jgi:thioester reductase-like protein
METSGAEGSVAELSELGVRVTVMVGDVTKPDSVSYIVAVFDDLTHRVDAICHSGTLVD